MPVSEERILRSELRWAAVSIGVVSVIMLVMIYAGLVHHINPPSNIETIDPKTLHLSGEFTEGNLGTRVAAPPIANAVFALTGKRIRVLPLEDGGIRFV